MYEIGIKTGGVQWVVVGEPEVHRQRGKWVVRQGGYDAGTGRRRVKQLGTFATKRDAMAHRKAAAAGRVGSDDETVGEFLEQSWLPSKAGRVEQSTLDQYAWAVRLHIVPMLGAVRLRDLTPRSSTDGSPRSWRQPRAATSRGSVPRRRASCARSYRWRCRRRLSAAACPATPWC